MILESSRNLIRFDAMCANIDLSHSAVVIYSYSLDIRIPLSLGVDVRAAYSIS